MRMETLDISDAFPNNSMSVAWQPWHASPEETLLAFRAVMTLYSATTLYLDITKYYGWQNGAFAFKYTHWVEVLTVLYFVMSVGSHFEDLLRAPTANLYACLLPLTLYLDIGFFVAIYPIRLLTGAEGGPFLSPTSLHKHLINLGWLLGDAILTHTTALKHPLFYSLPTPVHFSSVYGTLVPVVINASYILLAFAIRYKPSGEVIFNLLGNPEIPSVFRVAPGLWIYGAFSLWPIQILHLTAPYFICVPISNFLMRQCSMLCLQQAELYLLFLLGCSPFLYIIYGPALMKWHNAKRD